MTLQEAIKIALEGLACIAGFTTVYFWVVVFAAVLGG